MDETDQWLLFHAKQQARVAPHAASAALVDSTRSVSYRLRLHHLYGLPLFQADNCMFHVRAGVTLFDKLRSSFFGNTTFTKPVPYDMRKSKGKKGFQVYLGSDIYFHSKADVSECVIAIVEIILVQQNDDGVVEGEYSAGWSQVPLQLLQTDPNARNGACSPTRRKRQDVDNCVPIIPSAGAHYYGQYGTLSVPVTAGSPKFLVLKAALPDQVYQPQLLTAEGSQCRLHFTFDIFPEMENWRYLIPEHFLVVNQDVIPGVKRVDVITGMPTNRVSGSETALQKAQICSVHAVQMTNLKVQLPDGFLEIVRKIALPPSSPGPETPGKSGGPSRGLLRLHELQQFLRLRVTVHNGRTFVGPSIWSKRGILQRWEGCRGQHLMAATGCLELPWVPGDTMIRLVVELVLVKESVNCAAVANGVEVVLAWGALQPFRSVTEQGRAVVAEGSLQVKLRSGPGHWVRSVPVLDWRRLMENTNRVDPAAPMLHFDQSEACGREIWPPCSPENQFCDGTDLVDQACEGVQVHLLSNQTTAERTSCYVTRQPNFPEHSRISMQSSSEVLEAETLVPFQAGSSGHQKLAQKDNKLEREVQPDCRHTRDETVNVWRIDAHYGNRFPTIRDHPNTMSPFPAPVTEANSGPSFEIDNQAAFAGSPSNVNYANLAIKSIPSTSSLPVETSAGFNWWYPGSTGLADVRMGDVTTIAASALPLTQSLGRRIDLTLELADPLDINEITVQFLGIAIKNMEEVPACLAASSLNSPGTNGSQIYFTYRLYNNKPAVTSSVMLVPVPSGSITKEGQLYALMSASRVGESKRYTNNSSSSSLQGISAGTSVQSVLHNSQQWERQLEQLAKQGFADLKHSALRQLRLRAAQHLAERWLQVDVWDSISMLQVGTFSVPLYGLLRQGKDVTEVVYSCPIHNQAAMVERNAGIAKMLSPSLKGNVIIRLMNRGNKIQETMQPASPAKHQQVAPLVLRAKPALEVAGEVVQELATFTMGACHGSQALKAEILRKAQQKVERILHYRHISPQSGHIDNVDQLVHDQLLTDIEQARERCKSGVILKMLQEELASNVVLCTGNGEVALFEREVFNSDSDDSWYEVDTSRPSELSVSCNAHEWQALSDLARNAGLLCFSSSAAQQVVTNSRFKLKPQQRALLRFRWQSTASDWSEAVQVVDVRIHKISMGVNNGANNLSQQSNMVHAVLENGAPAVAAHFKVAVVSQLPALHRTLRLYHAAEPGAENANYRVHFGRLAGPNQLLRSSLQVFSKDGLSVSMLTAPPSVCSLQYAGPDAGVLLQLPPMPSGTSVCYQLTTIMESLGVVENWEVYAHSLPCLVLSAVLGETVTMDRHFPGDAHKSQLSCHSSCRDELEICPTAFNIQSSIHRQIQIRFTPQHVGARAALMTVVDESCRKLVDMVVVKLDSSSTRISRCFEVSLDRSKPVHKKVTYRNPDQQMRVLALRTNSPEIVRFSESKVKVGAACSTQIRLTLDPSNAEIGRYSVLVFLDDLTDRRVEECFQIVLDIC